jgi:hypothetical protein
MQMRRHWGVACIQFAVKVGELSTRRGCHFFQFAARGVLSCRTNHAKHGESAYTCGEQVGETCFGEGRIAPTVRKEAGRWQNLNASSCQFLRRRAGFEVSCRMLQACPRPAPWGDSISWRPVNIEAHLQCVRGRCCLVSVHARMEVEREMGATTNIRSRRRLDRGALP